jgi:hypothetical protein
MARISRGATNATLQAALQKLNFPGVAINVQERCVDVESFVCLYRGPLQLVACTNGTKEHESFVAVEARPAHIHAALLLLGAKPGSLATRKQLGDQADRWIDVPPNGGPGPRRYLSDQSGNVISHSTFGDELLCLPAIYSQDNDALMWQVNATNLPAVGSNVTLRLRPQILPAANAGTSGPAPAISVPK